MRKIVKLMAITTIAATTAAQVIACKDDSLYNTFISDVNSSKNNNTAFFGFLGSADDEISNALKASFDRLNQKQKDGQSEWQKWVANHRDMLDSPKVMLKDISLRYYQGPLHQNSSSDASDSLWNDKSIVWQKNIFNWIYKHTKNNDDFIENPKGVDEVEKLVTKKDGDTERFTKLPVVFIVSKGKLITAGQSWLAFDSKIDAQKKAISEFVLGNLLKLS